MNLQSVPELVTGEIEGFTSRTLASKVVTISAGDDLEVPITRDDIFKRLQ